MNASVASLNSVANHPTTKRTPSSRRARHVAAIGALLCAAGVLTALDSPDSVPAALPLSKWFAEPLTVKGSYPGAEATGVPGRAPLVVKFTAPMAAASLTPQSVTLVGPTGAERTRVMSLGALAVIQPAQELLPASRYTLFIKGATDVARRPLPLSAIGFDTAAKPPASISSPSVGTLRAEPLAMSGVASPASDVNARRSQLGAIEQVALARADLTHDSAEWIPDTHNFAGRWRVDRSPSPLQSLPSLQGPVGNTALTGQVLGMDGRAVPGVTLRVEDHEARTDLTGRFLLAGLHAGFAKMEIDGVTASGPDANYGYYAARIELAPGRTTVVPYTIWMPRLDPAGTIQINAPTTAETIVTSPRIPGLELHIPAGTVIRDRQGQIVTQINLTAIPVDRPPFPVPDLGVPVYFTVQPGGAVLQSVTGKPGEGARLLYPNFKNELPGARGTFWNYDPEGREWFVYGLGTISADAKQAMPDPGVVIHELTGAMFNGGNTPGADGPTPCQGGDDDACGKGGDPVATSTGQFDHVEHDAFVRDVVSIDITRTYNDLDINQRTFGIGMSHGYDVFLFSQHQWQEVDLILSSGSRIHYVRTSPGTEFADAIFESSAPGGWHNSIIARNQARAGWDLIFRNGERWFFPQFQPLTEVADRNGNVLRIVRQDNNGSSGKISRILSPNGRSLDFAYNEAGFVRQITDQIGRTYSYNYDATGHLTEVIDPIGGHRTYVWQSFGTVSGLNTVRLAEIHDARGNLVVRNHYDLLGRVDHQDLDDGSSYNYVYTLAPCPQPPPGSGQPPASCVLRPVSVDITSRRGTVRTVSFDEQGRVIANTYGAGLPEQQVVRYEYTNNLMSARVDPLARRTEYTYDTQGNVTSVTRLAGTAEAATWTTSWDTSIGKPLTITEPTGNSTVMAYDSKGNLLSLQNEPGQAWSFTYDTQGRLLTKTDPLGKITVLTYDGADLASVTDPLQRKLQVSTDVVGRQRAIIDPLGNRTLFHWDDLNRLLDITNAMGGVTSFAYDPNGNVTTRTDAKGHVTNYTHNTLNQTVLMEDPLRKQKSFAFEPGGKVAHEIDRNGKLKAMNYDPLGRLLSVGFGASAAHPTAFTSMIEDTWDVGGRITEIREKTCADPVGHPGCSSVATLNTTTREFDSFGRMIREVTPQGEVDYTYDSVGRRLTMTIKNGPSGAQVVQPTISYSYDHADQLISITQAAGSINGGQAQTIAFAHDGTGRRTQVTLANGTTVNYTHDDAGQVIAITYKNADSTIIGDLTYEYDANGHKVSVGGSLARTNLPGADVTDAVYDASNRLLTWAGSAYNYDDEGGLTSDGTNQYQWDEQRRLSAISHGASMLASFAYDSRGRRRAKTIGTTTTGFLYDQENVVQELDGITNSAPVRTHFLTGGLDQVFLRLEGDTGAVRRSLLSDLNNNTITLLDDAQMPVCSYTYEPYGATVQDGTSGNTLQYGGRENDEPGNRQGLYFNRARYYMPALGRFISQDPIGWASGQTNNYAYVGGDPIGFNDPTGLDGAAAGASGQRRGPRARRDATLEDRLERERSIRDAQDRLRRARVHEDDYLNADERIRATDKTEQNTDDALKDIRTAADGDEAVRDPFSEEAEAELAADQAALDDDALRTAVELGAAGTIGAVGGAAAAEAGIGASILAGLEGLEMSEILILVFL